MTTSQLFRAFLLLATITGLSTITGCSDGEENPPAASETAKPLKGQEYEGAPSVPPQTAPLRKHEVGKIFLEGEKLYSQNDEELIIRDFLKDRRDGLFLDIGAANAVFHSTTYYLEKHLGWRGIGVDALPRYAEDWRKKRPRSKFVNYAITDKTGDTMTFYEHAWPEVSSLSKEHAAQFGGEEHLTEVIVETITMNDLLERNGIKKIDHLTIDIEGAEMLALNGFDIERYRPDLICVEAHSRGKEGEAEIKAYFEAHGYELLEEYLPHDIANWYFAPRSASQPAT